MTTKAKQRISLHCVIPVLLLSVLVFAAIKWYRASKPYEPTFELTFPGPEFYDSLPPVGSQPPPKSPSDPERLAAAPIELTDADWGVIEATALNRYAEEAEADRTGLYKSSQEEAQIRQLYHLVRAATEWRLKHGK